MFFPTELIITAGGENVPPIPIEDAIKGNISIVSNAVLIGDRRKFLSMLFTLKVLFVFAAYYGLLRCIVHHNILLSSAQ